MTTQQPDFSSELGSAAGTQYVPNLGSRYTWDKIFRAACVFGLLVGLITLSVLVTDVLIDGAPRLSWQFLTSFPSRKPEQAGLVSALVGSIYLVFVVATFAFPIGVGAAIFLEEYAAASLLSNLIEINIANLAGVPSIIYGLLGLAAFVRLMEPITGGRTLLSGGLTLALLVLPIVIVSTREALRAVPGSLRQAGYALGATRWQVIRSHVLPQAAPGILTGTILALSRAIGETAPLIMIGALTFIAFLPDGCAAPSPPCPFRFSTGFLGRSRPFTSTQQLALLS